MSVSGSGQRGRSITDAREWFEVEAFPDGVTRIWEPGLGPLHAANIWLVAGRERDLLIDTGVGVAPLRPLVERLTSRPVVCLLTHGHYDHIGGAWEFGDRRAHAFEAGLIADPTPEGTMWWGWLTDAAFLRPPPPGFMMADYAIRPAPPTALVADGDVVDLGGRRLTILHVPGHSPGLLAIHDPTAHLLFTSDALYDGRMFFGLPGSDRAAGAASVARLAALPGSRVHPGHFDSFGADRLRTLARDAILRLHQRSAPHGEPA